MTTAALHSLTLNVHLERRGFTCSVNAELPLQGITSLFGPSGCGKTTLLRTIAGLNEAPKPSVKNQIKVTDTAGNTHTWLSEQGAFTPSWQRQVGLVFQKPALFPHLTVMQNLNYAWSRLPKAQRMTPLEPSQLVQRMGIADFAERLPNELSGGQQQRVALARTLASCPQLMLLDEPLANLDGTAKRYFIQLLKRLQQDTQIPMIYVSHQLDEVVQLSDRLILMDSGKLVSQGLIADVLQSNEGYARCQGENILFGEAVQHNHEAGLLAVKVAGTVLWFPQPIQTFVVGALCRIHFQAKDISLATKLNAHSSISNSIAAVIEEFSDSGHKAEVRVKLRIGLHSHDNISATQQSNSTQTQYVSATITKASKQRLALTVGATVYMQIKAVALSV